MTDKEVERAIRAIRKVGEEVKHSPEKARALLHATGMYTKKGNLKKRFR